MNLCQVLNSSGLGLFCESFILHLLPLLVVTVICISRPYMALIGVDGSLNTIHSFIASVYLHCSFFIHGHLDIKYFVKSLLHNCY